MTLVGTPAPADPDALVDALAAAVAACPSVARLSGGAVGEVATYLPGRRVTGVRMAPEGRVEVHVVAYLVATVATVEREVRAAVTALVGPRPVDVGIDDLELTPPPTAPRVR